MTTMEQEREARIEKIQALEKRLQGIVRKLGGTVVAPNEPNTWNANVESKAGNEGFDLSVGNYRAGWDRVSVSGNYPRGPKGEWVDASYYDQTLRNGSGGWVKLDDPKITISLAKTDEQIAAEIERRFLPGYRARLKLVLERIDATKKYEDSISSNLEALRKAIIPDKGLTDWSRGRREITEYLREDDEAVGNQIRLEAKALSDSAELKISNLKIEEAVALVKLAKKLAAERTA